MGWVGENTQTYNPNYPNYTFTYNYTGETWTMAIISQIVTGGQGASGHENNVDAVWHSIGGEYFRKIDNLGMTFQQRPDDGSGKKMDVDVRKLYQRNSRHYFQRAVVFEDASVEHERSESEWEKKLDQARGYVGDIRRVESTNDKVIYIVVNIGHLCAFFESPPVSDNPKPPAFPFEGDQNRYHFITDCVTIDQKLTRIRDILIARP